MAKNGEYQRKDNPVNNYRQNNNRSNNHVNQQGQSSTAAYPQNGSQPRNQRGPQEQGNRRENGNYRSYNRDNYQRQGHPYQNSGPRYNQRIRADETIDDIKMDISRIEKEIELELKEIKSLRLGM